MFKDRELVMRMIAADYPRKIKTPSDALGCTVIHVRFPTPDRRAVKKKQFDFLKQQVPPLSSR